MFHYFEKVNKGYLEMLKVKYEKWPNFAILPGTNFQSPPLNQKHSRNVCHIAH